MEFKRKRARIAVDIAVTLTTVLDSIDARIIDLSEHGAQIIAEGLSTGTKFQIEYEGQTVYAQCMWTEVDRIGARFPYAMTAGPLHDELALAIATGRSPTTMLHRDDAGTRLSPSAPQFGNAPSKRSTAIGFGRRTTV